VKAARLAPASCAWCKRRLPLVAGSHGICRACAGIDVVLSRSVLRQIFPGRGLRSEVQTLVGLFAVVAAWWCVL
jgi:hypothetical protein